MNASIRTLIYAAVAVCFAVAAFATHRAMQPSDPEGFNLVGQEFYPNFKSPDTAARLRVAAYDDLKEKSQVFTVEKTGEGWRIPSHHDYPAEAKKRLAETAASVMGIKREAVAGRREAEHERYGVIDPLDEESTAIRGRGQRITLFDEGGKELVDLIVGKQVEGQRNQYYVRAPGEKETYRTALDVKLSTKFSDWIEPDLLKLTTSELVALRSSKPTFEEKVVQTPFGPRTMEQEIGSEKVDLSRKDSSADWELADLNTATEEFDKASVSTVVSTIDDLKIIGVRPKPPGLTPEMKIEIPEEIQSDRARARAFLNRLGTDMDSKGFRIGQDEQGRFFVSTREGELIAGTKEGVVYNLQFGNRFEGSLDDIEFGAATDNAADDKEPAKDGADKEDNSDRPKAATDQPDEAEAGPDAADDDGDVEEGRYVLVRVEFDPQYIGEEPVAPVEPTKPPADDKPEEPADDAAKPKDPATAKPDDAERGDNAEDSDGGNKEDKPADGSKAEDETPDAKPDKDPEPKKSPAQLAYEEAMKDYESKNIKYISDKQDFEKKAAAGKKLVDRLNQRFQDWYYVISADSFETLRLSRATLVTEKEVTEQPPVEAPNPPAAAQPDKE